MLQMLVESATDAHYEQWEENGNDALVLVVATYASLGDT